MKKKYLIFRLFFLLTTSFSIAGCSGPKPMPSEITLKDALAQVKDGIDFLQTNENTGDKKKAGLLISEVNVTFNITATSNDKTQIGIDLAPGGIFKEIPSASFDKTIENGSSRGNQISFKFQNLFLANKDTLIGVSVTPITTTTEKTVTKDKDTTTEKTSQITQPLTLQQLYDMLNQKVILQNQ